MFYLSTRKQTEVSRVNVLHCPFRLNHSFLESCKLFYRMRGVLAGTRILKIKAMNSYPAQNFYEP